MRYLGDSNKRNGLCASINYFKVFPKILRKEGAVNLVRGERKCLGA